MSLQRSLVLRPGSSASPTARRPRISRWRSSVILAVSLATAVWLVAQMAAGLLMVVSTWPVAGFPMFSERRSTVFERRLTVRTRSGNEVVVRPADFGLDELQLLNYQRAIVHDAGMVRHEPAERLSMLAAVWNRAHPEDPAMSMTMTHVEYKDGPGSPPSSTKTFRWTAS
jgi:hypothetical protein